jgi:hypothetical protein
MGSGQSYAAGPREFHLPAGSAPVGPILSGDLYPASGMITLRVTRHDRNEQLLAECQSAVIPARGEVLQLDTVEADGSMSRPSTMWRIVAVTVHVPSLHSSAPLDGSPLRVQTVEVRVLPDVSLLPALHHAEAEVLSESRM